MEPKPSVFPTNEPKKVQVDSDYEANKIQEAEKVYFNAENEAAGLENAVDQMHQRTLEQIRLRDEQLAKNLKNTENYQQQMALAEKRPATETVELAAKIKSTVPESPVRGLTKKAMVNVSNEDSMRRIQIEQLSQPQWNMSFDVLPLPSEGKLYRDKKPTVKVAYMTTADENILTSPNLLQSGEFLEILINRKLLDTNLRYKDLHIGDRNAIMLWLRASSYGEMYPVTLLDEKDEPFDTEINLTELKTKKLNVEPNVEGLFDFVLPQSKSNVLFKLLTVGELEEIQKMVEADEANGILIDSTATYMLQRQIVEIDGERNEDFIKNFIETLRLRDGKALKDYISSIDCGVELQISVGTPGGGSISTFLPLNVSFFWPNLSV